MADQGGTNEGQGRVEIGLSFLSAQDSAAFREMQEAFRQAATMFDAMKASSFVAEAQKLSDLAKEMSSARERMNAADRARGEGMQERGGGIRGVRQRLADFVAPGQGGDDGGKSDDKAAREKANDEDKKRKDSIKQRMDDERQRRLEAMEHMTDPQRAAERMRMQAGQRPSGEFRIPSLEDEDVSEEWKNQEWYQRMSPTAGEQRGLRIPRFGELTVQDYLNQMRDRSLREALGAGREGDEDEMNRLGQQASHWDLASRWSGNIYAGQNLMRRLGAMATIQGLNFSQWDTAGASLGFRRDTNPFSDVLGMQTPFSAAGDQGARQWRNTLGMRMSAGINREQAQAITGAVAQAGFSGQQGTDVGQQFMQPMFRQFGVDPQALIPFTQTLRTGTSSIAELNRELGNLGELARTARVDVNTYAQALVASGEAAQAQGGYFRSGVQFGTTFTQATGLTPDVGNTVMQNPFTQAIMSGMTGLPSFALQSATAGTKVQATQEALRMRRNAYAGALGTQGEQREVRDRNGRLLGRVQGDDPSIASAASDFGIDADQAERMLRGEDFAARSVRLNDVLDMQTQRLDRALPRQGRPSDTALARAGIRVRRVDGRDVVERQVKSGAGGDAEWREDQQAADSFSKLAGIKVSSGNTRAMRDQLVSAAHDAGIRGKELGKAVDDEKDPKKRVENVRRLMAERAAEEQAKYQIAFTGPAKKLFKALVKDAGGNYEKDWNAPTNTGAGSTPGQAPLGPGGNTGITPTDFNTGSE